MHWLLLSILVPYLYIVLKTYRNLLKIRPYTYTDYPESFITIITACRNEEKNLPILLGDIASQDYPPDLYEVLVIDDNSSDSTSEIAAGFTGITNLRVYRNNKAGKKEALKTGIAMAKGRLIITLDADIRMNRGWLRTIVSFHKKEKPDMIICPVLLRGGRGFFNRFQELEFLSLQAITAGFAAAGDPILCNGANLSFTKEAFDKHSRNLHVELVSGDDVFLLHSIKKEAGSTILWLESEDATVTTATAPSLRLFLKQRARWISKSGAYVDRSIKITALAALAAVILQLTTLMAGIVETGYLVLFFTVFFIKSVPDYLLLKNTTLRYKMESLMKWFGISQFIYPFYVIAVIFAFFQAKRKSANFPNPKGI